MTTLVTGAYGFIGAWVARQLVREGETVYALDLSEDPQRLRLVMSDDEVARVRFIRGDVSDPAHVGAALRDNRIDTVIHLAALQVPFCRANPRLGARVNVEGTVNVLQCALEAGLKRIVYASSIAVYGKASDYPLGPVAHDAPLHPNNLYGAYKQADEHIARIYWQDDHISSIGVRPYTVYGPGRDQGLTSSPTKAMLAAAAGQDFHIPFGGRQLLQYAPDVAGVLVQAARTSFEGANCYNLGGSFTSIEDVARIIEDYVPGVHVTVDPNSLQLPERFDGSALESAIGPVKWTPLEQGIRETIDAFRELIKSGRVAAPEKST
jgi:UDP-glucuronate 4-epimerase